MIAQMLDSMNIMVESRKHKPHHWDVSFDAYLELRKNSGRYGINPDPTGHVRVLFGLPVVTQPSWTFGWQLVSANEAHQSNRL
jgi:hypothetical protein